MINYKCVKLRNSDKIVLVDEDDFERVNKYKWFSFYKKKNKRKKYIKSTSKINGKQITLHRFILNVTDPSIHVDHINGNPLDNRKENLRTCTISENNRNKSSHKNSTSAYLGVCYVKSKNKWECSIMYNKKRVFRKIFDTEIEAAKAYNEYAKKYFGEFANLNVINC